MLGGRSGHAHAAGRPVPEHRAAGDLHPGRLPGRLGRDRAGHGDAGHRAADERHRPPAVLLVRERQGRQHDDHPVLRAGHQSGHRAGAGAEQTAAGHAAAAAGGAAAGPACRQGHPQLPGHRRLRLDRRQHERLGHRRLRRLTRAGPDQPHQGVGDFQLFGTQYAMRIWLDPAKLNNFGLTPGGCGHGTAGAERAGGRRGARRPALDHGPAAERDDHRPAAPQHPGAVRADPAAGQHQRLARAAARCRAHRARAPRATQSPPSTTACRPPGLPSSWPRVPTRWTRPAAIRATLAKLCAVLSRRAEGRLPLRHDAVRARLDRGSA